MTVEFNAVVMWLVFAENSARLISNGLAEIIQDLAKMGYDCKWGGFTAAKHHKLVGFYV